MNKGNNLVNDLIEDVTLKNNTAEREAESVLETSKKVAAEADTTTWWEKVQKLKPLHETIDYGGLTFAPQAGFSLEDNSEIFSKQSRYVKEALMNATINSDDELQYQVEKYTKLEADVAKYSEFNFDNTSAHFMAAMLDPASWVIGLGTGGIGLGAKVAGAGVRGAIIDSAIAEVGIATMKLANNNVYDANDMLADIALSPIGGLPVGLMYLSKGKRETRRIAQETSSAYKDLNKTLMLEEKQMSDIPLTSKEQLWLDKNESYQSAYKGVRIDRYAKHARLLQTINPEAEGLLSRILQDPTGTKSPDQIGQGVDNAEAVAETVRENLKRFNEEAGIAIRLLGKETKTNVNGFRPNAIEKVVRTAQRRVLEASLKKDRSILRTDGERALFDAQTKVGKTIAKYGKERGTKLFSEVDADEFYIPLRYDTTRFGAYRPKEIVTLLTRGFAQGSDIDEIQATVLAKSMYAKLTDTSNGSDGVSGLVDNFEELIEYLSESDVMARMNDIDEVGIKLSDIDAVKALLGVKSKDPNSNARRRAGIDRTASIELEGGGELSFLDLFDMNAINSTSSYTNNMAGHMGIEVATNMNLRQFRNELGKLKKADAVTSTQGMAREVDNMVEDIESVLFGRGTGDSMGRGFVNNVSNLATMQLLGFAGAASLPNMAKTLIRNNFAGATLLLPKRVLPKSTQGMYNVIEQAEEMGYIFRSQSSQNMYSNALEESVEGSEGVVTNALRQGARFTAKVGGMDFMGRTIEQQAFAGGLKKLFKAAKKGKDSPILLSEAGWNKTEMDGIMSKLKGSPKARASGMFKDGEINMPDLDTWTPQELHKLYQGLAIFARRQSDRNFRGESNALLEHPLGRMMTQFRSIIVQSYAKKGLNALASLGTTQGMKDVAMGAMVESAALIMLYNLKSEAKMNGMSEDEQDRYAVRLGFESRKHYDKMFYGSMSERMEAMKTAKFSVFSGISSYSPTLSWMIEPFAIIASLTGIKTAGRQKSIEDTIVSIPAFGIIENASKTVIGIKDNFLNDTPYSLEQANRTRTLIPASSHPFVQWMTNTMFKEVDLEREK